MPRFVVVVCQLDSRDNKVVSVERALGPLNEAAADGTDFVVFPEVTTFIGSEEWSAEVTEALDGSTIQRFSEKAREHGVLVHIDSFFEWTLDSGRVHNMSAFIGPSGEMLDTYRKVHLFDIELDGSVEHRGPGYVTPGDKSVAVNTDPAMFGLSICYDLRLPGLYRVMAQSGANVPLIPSAFAMHAGKDHWEPLLRARAIENQAYVIAPGQIGDKPSWAETYGCTLIVDPWGNVISKARDREEIVTAIIDLSHLDEIRHDMQTLQHARSDVCERSGKWEQDVGDPARLAPAEDAFE